MTTPGIMWRVNAALLPGVVAATWWWGPGVLRNIAISCAAGLAAEAVCLRLLGRGWRPLRDGSTVVTALLIALSMPPGIAAHVVVIAAVAAVALAKYLYGGLGHNPFNPAMTGYALALVSYPNAMAAWPAAVDVTTGATALVTFYHRGGKTVADVWTSDSGFGALGGSGFEWFNAAVLAGGIAIVAMKVVHWRIPVAVLIGLGVCAAAGYDAGSSSSLGSPVFHWFTGGTMLAALFVATDPVTHPSHPRDQWLFGLGIGAAIWVFRAFAGYPDGIAFAVLLANAVTPVLDRRRAGSPARA